MATEEQMYGAVGGYRRAVNNKLRQLRFINSPYNVSLDEELDNYTKQMSLQVALMLYDQKKITHVSVDEAPRRLAIGEYLKKSIVNLANVKEVESFYEGIVGDIREKFAARIIESEMLVPKQFELLSSLCPPAAISLIKAVNTVKKLSGKTIVKVAKIFDSKGYEILTKFTAAIPALTHLLMDKAVVIGFLPLTHIQECEIAHSGKILKFRADGSVFLAQQKGGKDTVKIKGVFVGNERWIEFYMLWLLFVYGQSQILEAGPGFINKVGQGAILAKSSGLTTFRENSQKPSYVHHRIFPVVTRYEILTNCYIETFVYEETVIGGKDAIYYSVLLRTYEGPQELELYGSLDGSDKAYLKPVYKKTWTQQMFSYTFSILWRKIRAMREGSFEAMILSLDPTDKSKGYNIDAIDLGYSFVTKLLMPKAIGLTGLIL